jgi:hypothetical protein
MHRRLMILATLVAIVLSIGSAPAAARSHDAALARSTPVAHHPPRCRAADITPHPSKDECSRAKKILTSWERLANKIGIKLPKKRLQELRRKTQDGTIRISDLPATLRRAFPSELDRYDLNQIINICNGLPPGNGGGITV